MPLPPYRRLALCTAVVLLSAMSGGSFRHLTPGPTPVPSGITSLADALARNDTTGSGQGSVDVSDYQRALLSLVGRCGTPVEWAAQLLIVPLGRAEPGNFPRGHILEILRYAVAATAASSPTTPPAGTGTWGAAGSVPPSDCAVALAGRLLAEADRRPDDTDAYRASVATMAGHCPAYAALKQEEASQLAVHVIDAQEDLVRRQLAPPTLRSLLGQLSQLIQAAPDRYCDDLLAALGPAWQDAGRPPPATQVLHYLQLATAVGSRCGTESEQTGPGSLPAISGQISGFALLKQIDYEQAALADAHVPAPTNLAILDFLDAAISEQTTPPAAASAGGFQPPNTFGCSSATHVYLLAGQDGALTEALRFDRLAVSVAWRCQGDLPHEGILLQQLDDNVAALAAKGRRTSPRLAQLEYLDRHLPAQPPLQATGSHDCADLLHAFVQHPT